MSFGLTAQTHINSLGSHVWNSTDEPKTFNNKLQLSFVRSINGFPSYGTVLAGGGYSRSQDGSSFQLYFPYNEEYGGIAPKIRLGKYNNQGWSNWETFYTSANANKSNIDWSAKTIIANDKIGIGTANIPADYKLAVAGKIIAEEVKVQLRNSIGVWPDYVFSKEYNLPSLEKVEQHIKDKGHLKDIPSAENVKENGILLGKMDSKLLQKIEELTLYTIEQEKRLNSIDLKNETLEKENEILKALATKFLELQKRLEKLEKK